MRQKCIDQRTPPKMELGAVVKNGEFYRNLKKKHAPKRYSGDNDENPKYGYKIANNHWKSEDQHEGQLSVNLVACIHSEVCSIAIHPNAKDYFHVALINLDRLNEALLGLNLNSPLVAQYRPITGNLCHFEIMPRDGTTLMWFALATFLDDAFPHPRKMPARWRPHDARCRQRG